MAAEEHDIIARISSGATSSTGALAAHLASTCGHVLLDQRVVAQGYRFHPELSDEIPGFFNKRLRTGSTGIAITLQGGIDPDDGSEPLPGCTSTADVVRLLDESDHHASVWQAHVTVDVQMLEVAAVAEPLFIARHPNEFRLVAEELVALGILQARACPLCSSA
jgi:hypothetical protein